MAVSAEDVVAFMDLDQNDEQAVALAQSALTVITAIARAYTRGNGFHEDGTYDDGIGAVLTTATARTMSNPAQVPNTVGTVTVNGGFVGWTMAERYVLDSYRVRAV